MLAGTKLLPMKSILYLFFLSTIFLSGCGLREREISVQKKEAELARKERELLAREEALQLKEEAITKIEQKIDSTRQDSTVNFNPAIVGSWSVRMVCTETTCPGSAIGDTKSEIWTLAYQDERVIAKALTDNVVVRTYVGTYNNNTLELTENVELTPGTPSTKIIVRLNLLDENTMEGQRTIIRSEDCRIVYALQLNK